jgi:hypothetical protein
MAILATEKVLTLDYWKSASNLQTGDYVFDKDGNIVQVKLIQTYHSEHCYRIWLDDLLSTAGDDRLGFFVEDRKHRQQQSIYKGIRKFRRPLKFIEVRDLLDTPLVSRFGTRTLSIPTARPLKLPHQTLPVPPFVFGYWFVNRKAPGKLTFTNDNDEFITRKFKDSGYGVRKTWKMPRSQYYFHIKPTIESQLAPNIPYKIPNNYLLADEEQRIELLRGILNGKSEQYSVKKDRFRFSSPHYSLILQVQCLVESLGNKTNILHDKFHERYVLSFRSRIKLVENQNSPPFKVNYGRRYIHNIEPLPPQVCVYIETTAPDNSIVVGEGFISTC